MEIRNKILITLLLFVAVGLNAQYVVKQDGHFVVHYGSFVKSTESTTITEEEVTFDILYEWDFEDMPYGLSTLADWRTYMVEDDRSGLDWAQDTIIDVTIDGVTSKAARVMNYSGDIQKSMQYWTFFDSGQTGYEKLYYSYHVRFDEGFEAVSSNGKLPGILVNGNAYETEQDCPADSANGSTIGYLYKAGIRFSDYQYSHNLGTSCPWTIDQYEADVEFYFAPGTWYEITQYLVMNSSDGTSDGIQEISVNGKILFQSDTMRWRQNEFHKFDGLKFTFFQSAPSTTKTSSWTTDNHTVWEPLDDSNYDNGTLHSLSYTVETPITLSNRDHYYDHLGTTDGTYSTPSYPSATSSGHHEAWRFTGSTNVEITFEGALGGSDFLFVIDGATSDDNVAYTVAGYDDDISNNFDGGGATFTSSGTDVIVYTVNSEGSGFTKIQMTVDIDPAGVEPEFNILHHFDYSTTLGVWDETEEKAYYDSEPYYGYDRKGGATSIEEITYNGSLDTALRMRHWDDGIPWCPTCEPPTYGMWGSGGAQITMTPDTSMYEAFCTYYFMATNTYVHRDDSKMPGMRTVKTVNSGPIPMDEDTDGWLARVQYKAGGGQIDTYNYDFSHYNTHNPWAYGNTFAPVGWEATAGYGTHNSWHKMDIRIKMNTWTGGVANWDGIQEVALDDNLIIQMDELRFHTIDAAINKIGMSISSFQNEELIDPETYYFWFDDYILYIPLDAEKLGLAELHTSMWPSPLPVPTDDLYSDSIIDIDTENVTMINSDGSEHYMWIIDAGSGNKVTVDWNSGDVQSTSVVICFEGKKAGGAILQHYASVSDMSAEADAVSAGQYMYIYLTSGTGGGVDLSGNVTFSSQ